MANLDAFEDSPLRPSDMPDTLIAHGRYWATTGELSNLLGRSGNTLRQSLLRLRNDGRLFSPARGFYVVIPPEFQTWGSVPPDWFIDPMMEHLARGYYVGLLTAAAFHGAAHQQPQVFQVVVNKHLADRDYGRAHLRFMVSDRVPQMDVERRHTHTGTFNLATRETTLVDMAWRPQASGGISNVATVAREIGPLDGERIARLAMVRNRATARRLGWLLEQFRQDVDRHWLRVVARTDEGDATLLGPGEPKRGRTDRLWGVVVNTQVDVDL